jgi:hypothetical protein
MPWKNGYYVRNRREGKTVVAEYIGHGDFARLLARLDEHERQQRQAAQAAEREELDRLAAEDARYAELDEMIGAVVAGLHIATGHHTHKRQWRKKRA